MAELPVDLAQLVDAARTVFVTCGSATITQPSAASAELQMQFATPENATKFTHAMGDLFRAFAKIRHPPSAGDQPALEPSSGFLEAQPTKPLDAEIRQWAMERALQGRAWPYDDESRRLLRASADQLVAYVLHGGDAA